MTTTTLFTHNSNEHPRDEMLKRIVAWATDNPDLRALLLTSSLVNPYAPVDDFSDLDLELIFEYNGHYISHNDWTLIFGHPIAMIEEDETAFEGKYAMKMILYKSSVKVDFKLFSKAKFLDEVHQSELSEDWDIGYRVLLDKDKITTEMPVPTYQHSLIKKPKEEQFRELLNDFWWDTTYVAKCLAREDIFYAKYMCENIIRTEYLVPLIEWYIGSDYDWNITTNKHGRLFKQYLSSDLWEKIEMTFSGSDITENWIALFAMIDLVSAIGKRLSEKLGYAYPFQLQTEVTAYLEDVKTQSTGNSTPVEENS